MTVVDLCPQVSTALPRWLGARDDVARAAGLDVRLDLSYRGLWAEWFWRGSREAFLATPFGFQRVCWSADWSRTYNRRTGQALYARNVQGRMHGVGDGLFEFRMTESLPTGLGKRGAVEILRHGDRALVDRPRIMQYHGQADELLNAALIPDSRRIPPPGGRTRRGKATRGLSREAWECRRLWDSSVLYSVTSELVGDLPRNVIRFPGV